MKKTALLLFLIFWLIPIATAQQGINYKAIISDDAGNMLASTSISVQFTILQDGTTEVYKESHNPTTNANGIIVVNIGEGTLISGDFNTIDWGSAPHFLKTEIDKGDGYADMGTTEFKTVPYALHARTSESTINSSGGQYYFADKDGDGFGDAYNPVFVPTGATPPVGFIIEDTDCNDEDKNINPSAEDIPFDNIDNNCDGINLDLDQDGDGFSVNQMDCNDANDKIYPEAREICFDQIDQDCDGLIDENCFDDIFEPNNELNSAIEITANTYRACNVDWFYFTLSPDDQLLGNLEIGLFSEQAPELRMELYDSNYNLLTISPTLDDHQYVPFRYDFQQISETTTFYIQVNSIGDFHCSTYGILMHYPYE